MPNKRKYTGCLHSGCTASHHAHGYCNKHSRRVSRHGKSTVSNRYFWPSDVHKNLFHNAKYRAKKYNLDFTIKPEDIVIPEICPMLGLKLVKGNYHKQRNNSPSLDRLNNKKGYVKGNILVISLLANRIKNDASKEEIRKVADYLYSRENQNA